MIAFGENQILSLDFFSELLSPTTTSNGPNRAGDCRTTPGKIPQVDDNDGKKSKKGLTRFRFHFSLGLLSISNAQEADSGTYICFAISPTTGARLEKQVPVQIVGYG